ncbi:hypothetical protein FNYG_14083 [Fusarium nygamai]|uniref:Uncharacterized protein n=1 Tax=Gibberella nygamai TaxID=42673 RepID=A0A2K0UTP8_GIBNY|nr:hypothetical protein FNYG_14083 [Fusarium nygamai]
MAQTPPPTAPCPSHHSSKVHAMPANNTPTLLDDKPASLTKCNEDDLDVSHLARRVPAPAVSNKRKHIEKQLHLDLKRDAKKLGQRRLTSKLKKKMQEQGMTSEALTYHLRQGKKRKKLCQIHCGLFPLASCYMVNMGAKFSGTPIHGLNETESEQLKMMMENIADNETAKKLLRVTEAAVEQGEKVQFAEDVDRDEVIDLFGQ